jgi:hypothetical protein
MKMKYYFVDNSNTTTGPIDEQELRKLNADGVISNDTWVLPEGGADWQHYRSVFLQETSSKGIPLPPNTKSGSKVFSKKHIIIGLVATLVLGIVFRNSGPDLDVEIAKNPMSGVEFQAKSPRQPVPMRVWAKLDTFYNYDYSQKETTYISVGICFTPEIPRGGLSGRRKPTAYGYISRQADDAGKLLEILKDGRFHTVILNVSYARPPKSLDHFEIEGVVREGWSDSVNLSLSSE